METVWLSPTGFVTGDPTLQISYPFVAHPSTVVTCTAPGDLKWVSIGLRLPPNAKIEDVIISYEVSSPQSFIAQIRLAEMETPDHATVLHDDPTPLQNTSPASYTSHVGGLPTEGAVTLELRLHFQNASDEIRLGALGVTFQLPAEYCVNSIVALKALGAGVVSYLTVLGYYTPGDGGGGNFYWDASASEPDNAGTIIVPASNPPMGRWKRIYSEPLNVRWFGAKGDGKYFDIFYLQAAVKAVLANPLGGTLFCPAGTYKLTGQLTVSTFAPQGIRIYGEGSATVFNFTGTEGGIVANTTYNVEVDHIHFTGSVSNAVYFAGQTSTTNRGPCSVHHCFFDGCCTQVPAPGRGPIASIRCSNNGIDGGWFYENEFIGNGARSANVGAVQSTGTNPPIVTLSGLPADLVVGMMIEITTGGTLDGGMVFQWSQDGGNTFTTGVTGASRVVLGSSGFTANFASSKYTNDNVYMANFYSAVEGFSINADASSNSTHLHCFHNRITALWDQYGIGLYDTDYSEIVNNTIDMGGPLNRDAPGHEVGGYGTLCYSFSPKSGNRIQGNTITNSAGEGIYIQSNIDFQCSGNVLVNTCQNQSDVSLLVGAIAADLGQGSITGNTIKTSGKHGIELKGNYYTVTGNRIDGCAGQGIELQIGNNVTIVGNQISNCSRGIYSLSGFKLTNCSLVGNVIYNATGASAIDLSGATNCSIIGNQIDTAALDGILVYGDGSYNIVQCNGVTGAANDGWAYEIQSPNSLVLNNIATSGAQGIRVSGNYCSVSGNDMSAMSVTSYSLSGTGLVALSNRTTSDGMVGGPTITGSRGGNVALASLLTNLASVGLAVDSTSS